MLVNFKDEIYFMEGRLSVSKFMDDIYPSTGSSLVVAKTRYKAFLLVCIVKCHSGDSETESRGCVEKSLVMAWFEKAVNYNVEKLDVSVSNQCKCNVEFPACVFVCGSLRSPSATVSNATLKALIFSTCSISNLVFLRLRNVTVEDEEGFCRWVSFYCRFIKELRLECVRGLKNINIRARLWNHVGFGVTVKISGEGPAHVAASLAKARVSHQVWVCRPVPRWCAFCQGMVSPCHRNRL